MSLPSQEVTQLSPEKQKLLSLLLKRKGADFNTFPLSFSQKRLWFLNKLEPNSPAYNLFAAFQLTGALNAAVFDKSLQEIVRRHESLRTTFMDIDGKPVQCVKPVQKNAEDNAIKLVFYNLQDIPPLQQDRFIQELSIKEALRPFDLAKGPLLRAQIIRCNAYKHILLLTMHHIVSDGWSVSILFEELTALYKAFVAHKPTPLTDLPIQYTDYVRWQETWLAGKRFGEQLSYWKSQLDNAPPLLELPTDRPRPATQSFRGATLTFTLPKDTSAALISLSQHKGVSLFMTLLAAFDTLLYRITGQTDLLVGTPIANRHRVETEGLIGFFVNTLIMRVDLSQKPTFFNLLEQVREVALDAYDHQDMPLEKILDELHIERNVSYTPLFQVMFVLQNAPMKPLELPGLMSEHLDIDSGTAKFDLSLSIEETPDHLIGSLEYNTDIFDTSSIERLQKHLRHLLTQIVAAPERPVSYLDILTPAEQHQLLVEWNATRVDSHEATVLSLFDTQAQTIPDAVAVASDTCCLTYGGLAQRANQLAWHLQTHGVGPEVRVGILMNRSPELVIALLAVLKAGGVYVPLDPTHPQERLIFMINDSQSRVLLTQSTLTSYLPANELPTIYLDLMWKELAHHATTPPPNSITDHHLAYTIYTSGSTGRPKGVMVPHGGLVNYLRWAARAYGVIRNKVIPTHTSIGFDLTITSLILPLIAGAQVVLIDDQPGVTALVTALENVKGFHLTKLTPAHLELLSQTLEPSMTRQVDALIVGGESLTTDMVAFWRTHAPQTRIINEYGPTETVVGCSTYEIDTRCANSRTIPIGRPIDNTQLYILDEHQQPVPIGVYGELFIGGEQVARGYLGRPDLTAERFIPNPFDMAGERLYRTGDWVRYLPDGEIEFLGRIDHQVKLRGFRIELGEIEAVLQQHPAVQTAVVTVWQGPTDKDKRIVAYLVGMDGHELPDVTTWRTYLGSYLPEYMIPTAYVSLPTLPLTRNGKVDHRALPDPVFKSESATRGYIAPQTIIEEQLAHIWSDILGLPRVSIHDNFFELGGDSILSIQVITRAHQVGISLTPKQMFQHQTIATLAQATSETTHMVAEQDLVVGEVPLIPIQQQLLERSLPDTHHWNQSLLLALREPLHISALEGAIHYLLTHHDALRTRFTFDEGGWRQYTVAPDTDVPLTYFDYTQLRDQEAQEAIQKSANEMQAVLNLDRGPLIRFAFFNCGTNRQSYLFIVAHHLVIDGVSWRILLNDLQQAYQNARQHKLITLAPKTTSFQHWARQLTKYSQSDEIGKHLAYWNDMPWDEIAPLPRDKPHGHNLESNSRNLVVTLDRAETRTLLQDIPKTYRTRINDILLTALVNTIAQWTTLSTVLIDLESHGRSDQFEQIDLSRTVGWFTSVFPLVFRHQDYTSLIEQLRSVKDHLRSVPDHGLSYGLLRWLRRDTTLQTVPQAEIVFNYLGQLDQTFAPDGLFQLASESSSADRSPRGERQYLIEVNGQVTQGQLIFEWSYSDEIHYPETIEHLAHSFLTTLRTFLVPEQFTDTKRYVPSDFSLVEVQEEHLEDIQAQIQRVTEQKSTILIEDIYPLSPTQQGLLFRSLYTPKSGAYFEQVTLTLDGTIDTAAFEQAWWDVLAQHPTLRTTFLWEGLSEPVQIVYYWNRLPIHYDDWRPMSSGEQSQYLEHVLTTERFQGFDLTTEPLIRISLLQIADQSHYLILSFHHLIMDGWSIPIVFQDFFRCYQARLADNTPQLQPTQPYREYISWLYNQDRQQLEAYWRTMLKGFKQPSSLADPNKRSISESSSEPYGRQQLVITEKTTTALEQLARTQHITLNTLVMGVWALTLSSYSNTKDIVFGTTVSGRTPELPGIETMVGLFINTLPMRVQIKPDSSFLTWVAQLQTQQLELRQYEYSPLVDVQGWSDVPRGQALFDSIFVFENYPVDEAALNLVDDLTIRQVDFVDQADFPLSVLVMPGEELTLGMGYDTQRLTPATITKLLQLFCSGLEYIAQEPDKPLVELLQHIDDINDLSTEENLDDDIDTVSNLTQNQMLIWASQQVQPDFQVSIGAVYHFAGAIDYEHFRAAFTVLLNSSDALHTVIKTIDHIPQQYVRDTAQTTLPLYDLSDELHPEQALRSWIETRKTISFHHEESLVDSALIKLSDTSYAWYINIYHIVVDGWSFMLIYQAMATYYALAQQGTLHQAQPLPAFQDYVAHERRYRESRAYQTTQAYWQQKIQQPIDSMTFYGRPGHKTTAQARRVDYHLGLERSQQLEALAHREDIYGVSRDATIFQIFITILSTYLYHISGSQRFRIGSMFHNRTSKFRNTIGYLMSVAPLYTSIDTEDTFVSLIKKVSGEVFTTLRHSRHALKNPLHHPIYDVTINYHRSIFPDFADISVRTEWVFSEHMNESLALQVHDFDTSGAISLSFDMHCDVFSEQQQEWVIQHFIQVLDQFLANPEQRLCDVSLVSPQERTYLLETLNENHAPFPVEHVFIDLFERQVAQTPDNVAVVHNGAYLTYTELDERATQIATHLQAHGVHQETLVSILAPRSSDFLATMLAIFKCGGAYLPLDPDHPPQRIGHILTQSQCHLVLVTDAHLPTLQHATDALSPETSLQILCIEDLITKAPTNAFVAYTKSLRDLAYVIYTSGSTGTPKGAMVEQRGMVNHLYAKIHDLQMASTDHIAQTASQCFDISVWQFLAGLLVGGRTVIVDDVIAHHPTHLLHCVEQEDICILEVVPSLLQVILEDIATRDIRPPLNTLRWLIPTGEALPPAICRQWLQWYPHIGVVNAYGPTECSDDVTHCIIYQPPADDVTVMPIGKPIINTQVYVLNEQLQPVPMGMPGELYIGGVGVGRGYRNDRTRTLEAFVANPFSDEPHTFLYKTGDLVRYLPDGNLEFLGRVDHQVKIRGFRIELGEIEAVLLSHPAIRAAAVIAREDVHNQPYLAAYVVLQAEKDLYDVRYFLTTHLPEYMIPKAFVTLETLPQTRNGKLDRKALPEPTPETSKTTVAPRNDLERQLVNIWEELLEYTPIGITDNFFDLGGHSILAVRLMFRIQKLIGRQFPLAILFDGATIEALAQTLQQHEQASWSSLVPIQPRGTRRPFFCVHAHGGGAIAYYELAQHLHPEQPFYGLQAQGLDGHQEPHTNIPDMAAHYIEVMREVQPEGPYLIGGHSFGGLVAFEMANQLQAQGHEIGLLAIIDTTAPVAGNIPNDESLLPQDDDETLFLVEICQLVERILHTPLHMSVELLQKLPAEERQNVVLERLKEVNFIAPDAGLELVRGLLRIHKTSSQATWNYVNQANAYEGALKLFLSQSIVASDFRAASRPLQNDATLGWKELIRGDIAITTVPGDHISMLTLPHVPILAERLQSWLEEVQCLGEKAQVVTRD
ncbi:MAG: amino acid adenylation domain-containing protein [Chloroflexota bacterium]